MTAIFAYIINRMKEPSTYAGLASLLGLVGVNLAPEHLQAIVSVATAIAAAVAVFVPDLNKPEA
ncbi:uncharacterized membrane protein YjjB (DUF3815 family) [Bradyrhizobium sp. AZCC 1578]|uniref:hypothetical protein n=1 Tax=Bradyrhizobium sp. AZCC 1578 TaxID=3117027 RepID=UPI002FEEAB48